MIGEVWNAIRAARDVSRTTVLNLVDRLEKRGWLKRRKDQGSFATLLLSSGKRSNRNSPSVLSRSSSMFDGHL